MKSKNGSTQRYWSFDATALVDSGWMAAMGGRRGFEFKILKVRKVKNG
jgi:hypothetical protein